MRMRVRMSRDPFSSLVCQLERLLMSTTALIERGRITESEKDWLKNKGV